MRTHGKALILLAMMSTAAHAGVLLDKTDRFTGVRGVAWNSIPANEGEFSLSTLAFYAEGESTPRSYSLELTTYSANGEYATCHFTSWLIDGKRAPELEGKYVHDPAGNVVVERFTASVSRDLVAKVAAAKLVEFKVCGTEGVVSSADIDGARQVLDATK